MFILIFEETMSLCLDRLLEFSIVLSLTTSALAVVLWNIEETIEKQNYIFVKALIASRTRKDRRTEASW